jgi:segregation and condensation protein B
MRNLYGPPRIHPGQSPGVAGPWTVVQAPKADRYRIVFRETGAGGAPVDGGNRGAAARDVRLARLEAVLLLASEPLSSRKLAQFSSLADGTEARTLVRVLNRLYDAQGTAFRVEEVAGGFQLLSRGRFGPWLRRLYQAPVEARLSSPALETLAVVAYRQPVLRAEIEAIRGVQSGEMLRQLMERDLVRITGRSPELGRPFLYGTTRRFLRMFGLRHLDEMPRVEALREAAVNSTLAAGLGPKTTDKAPAVAGDQEIPIPSYRQEECEVKISALTEPSTLELLNRPADRFAATMASLVAAKDEDEEDELEEDEADDDDEDDDEEDDLEEDEWEEVDDDEEDDDLDDDDDDWDDDDDDDWDDDEEDDEEDDDE